MDPKSEYSCLLNLFLSLSQNFMILWWILSAFSIATNDDIEQVITNYPTVIRLVFIGFPNFSCFLTALWDLQLIGQQNFWHNIVLNQYIVTVSHIRNDTVTTIFLVLMIQFPGVSIKHFLTSFCFVITNNIRKYLFLFILFIFIYFTELISCRCCSSRWVDLFVVRFKSFSVLHKGFSAIWSSYGW